MGIKYQEEKLSDCLEEMKPMLKKHWEELANNKDIRPLEPNYQLYLSMNEMQIVKVFTVRSDAKLIGYSIWIVHNHMHYGSWMYAVSDIYWLEPEHRKTGVSFDFFFKIEDWLKSFGVKSITVQDKMTHKHNSFFNRLGYTHVEQVYEKII